MARAPAPAEFSCSCGQVQGHLSAPATRAGTHLACFCADCRAALLYLEQPDPLPDPVGIFHTTPDAITLTQGGENLGSFRLSFRGPFRWYATCCKSAMFITLATPKLPFSALMAARLSDPATIGPVRARVNMKQPDGKLKHNGMGRVVWALASRMLTARLSGRWRQTPFFDQSGTPTAKPLVLDKKTRSALYTSQRNISG